MRIRHLDRRDYVAVWRAMQRFTDRRGTATEDQIWLTEHFPVYTLGQAGRLTHLRAPVTGSRPSDTARDPVGTRHTMTLADGRPIPVIRVDRGGQVTYHGPGQVVAYTLVDLRRRGWGVKRLVHSLEQATIDLLGHCGIAASARPDAPGVYVEGAKIASLGLRVRRGCAYHGLALNVAMDLTPFDAIDPCGLAGLRMTQLSDLVGPRAPADVSRSLGEHLADRLRIAPHPRTHA